MSVYESIRTATDKTMSIPENYFTEVRITMTITKIPQKNLKQLNPEEYKGINNRLELGQHGFNAPIAMIQCRLFQKHPFLWPITLQIGVGNRRVILSDLGTT